MVLLLYIHINECNIAGIGIEPKLASLVFLEERILIVILLFVIQVTELPSMKSQVRSYM